MTLLELVDLRKSYGDVTALSGIDLTVEAGTFHGLVGPNGSGKTTLFRIVLGLTRPSGGEISLPDGHVGCGFQRPNFYRGLTVAENLSVFSKLADDVDPAWREELVDVLRLDRVMDRRAGDISGGFAKKLDLTLALLERPSLVLLDEPFGDLDDVSKARLLEFLADYRDEGNAVLVSTHHLGDFDPLVDHLTVLYDGDVVLDADRDDIDLGDRRTLQELYVDQVVAIDKGLEPPVPVARVEAEQDLD
jgi:ABC-2 type transport system ATP-binding protein